MNKVKMIKDNVKQSGMNLGDIYQRPIFGQSEDYSSYYICCVDCENSSKKALYDISTGHRWGSYSICVASIKDGTFVKLQKGSKIEIEVQ